MVWFAMPLVQYGLHAKDPVLLIKLALALCSGHFSVLSAISLTISSQHPCMAAAQFVHYRRGYQLMPHAQHPESRVCTAVYVSFSPAASSCSSRAWHCCWAPSRMLNMPRLCVHSQLPTCRCMLRCRVGPCNGIEWLPRFMPKWLQDRVLSTALGIKLLEPEMKLNAAVLAARWQQQQRPQQQSGQREVKKER